MRASAVTSQAAEPVPSRPSSPAAIPGPMTSATESTVPTAALSRATPAAGTSRGMAAWPAGWAAPPAAWVTASNASTSGTALARSATARAPVMQALETLRMTRVGTGPQRSARCPPASAPTGLGATRRRIARAGAARLRVSV